MQQPMRKGGVRECFVPRPGFLFLATDYSFIELVSWAQVCLDLFGVSDLADLIREGKDPHSVMAVEILHAAGEHLDIDYDGFRTALKAGEEWAADARQLAKAANFGLPGGLGAKTFIDFAWANYGVRISLEKAENVKRIWKRMYREADMYFAHIKSLGGAYGESFQIVQLRSGRVRGGCTFTSAANSFFQGLTADGTEEADWRITKECYLGSSDLALAAEVRAGRRAPEPLYGCRPVAFLHDEFILEVPGDDTTEASIDAVHAANVRLKEHMIEGMKVFVPDVPVGAEESLMRRWYKGAKPVFDEKGRLRVWEPKER
jgi:DNA polymerase-1